MRKLFRHYAELEIGCLDEEEDSELLSKEDFQKFEDSIRIVYFDDEEAASGLSDPYPIELKKNVDLKLALKSVSATPMMFGPQGSGIKRLHFYGFYKKDKQVEAALVQKVDKQWKIQQ